MDESILEEYVEYFEYLDELRDSGETNMFGAGPYLEAEFGLGRYDARKIVQAWMETFDPERSVESRVEESYASWTN
jgi:hypothetical protein